MSSPIHQAEDLDPALRYAPRWARDRGAPLAGRPFAPPSARPARRARPEFSGDRAMLELQRQLVLDPDAIVEAPSDDARILAPIALRLSAVIGLAALIAWGVVALPGMKKAGEILPPDVKTPAIAVTPVKPVKLVEVKSSSAAPQVSEGFVAMTDPAPVSSPPVPPSAPAPVSSPPVPTSAPPPAPSPTPAAAAAGSAGADHPGTLHIDAAEVATMLKRGKDYLMIGDLASARLLLRRAAEAGSAEAALALGATFDPQVIHRLGAVGATSDVAQARQWYRRAADLGSAAASEQLAKLAQSQ